VYCSIVMEPDLVMLALHLPSGHLVFDRSGCMRVDTIPSPLEVTEGN
jgi:hypothetical protein